MIVMEAHFTMQPTLTALEKLKHSSATKHIKTNIFRIQANDSVMYG